MSRSGHEFCGIVDKVASGVTSLKQGDRVVASANKGYLALVNAQAAAG